MKRALGKWLFPNLPRLVRMKRVDMIVVVFLLTMVGSILVVTLMLTHNNQIGK